MEPRQKLILTVVVLSFILVGLGLMLDSALAQEAGRLAPGTKNLELGSAGIGAGLAIGGAGLGAGIGLGIAVSSIVAAGAERPEIIGRFFIFIVFIEAIAIYGLIISILLITFLPQQV